MTIPIGITARNEAASLPGLFHSLGRSAAAAERDLGVQFEWHLLLNDNDDNSAALLSDYPEITVWHTSGGLVEAQRTLVLARPNAEFVIFSDADIRISEAALTQIVRAMLDRPELAIAYAEKYPLPPRRRTPLARALYLYNLHEGYQTRRNYCNGQLFAIRRWEIPAPAELHWVPARNNPFLNLEAGIRTDDIYLSRAALARSGPDALYCAPAGIEYRPPETLRGMFRKYQRMRLEIERLDCYFPASRAVQSGVGKRRPDRSLLRAAPVGEQLAYGLFQFALLLCKAAYNAQKLYYGYLSRRPCPTWLPVTETKEPIE